MPRLDRGLLEMALLGYQSERARIESQKTRIDAAIADIQARLGNQHPARPAELAPKKRRRSAAARRRMALAQKKRWAAAKETEAAPEKPKRKLSPAGRKAISEASKKRWAAIRAAKAQKAAPKAKATGKAVRKPKAPKAVAATT